jgi:hypothetical protein
VRRVIYAAIIVLLIFEVGIRFVPADGMTYVVATKSGQVVYQYSTANQKVVSSWQNALNTSPRTFGLLIEGCIPPPGTWESRTYTFTWHGIPVESAWNNFGGDPFYWASTGDGCPVYIMSNGGIPDIFLRSVPQQDPPAFPA